jgi:hypothetical protein
MDLSNVIFDESLDLTLPIRKKLEKLKEFEVYLTELSGDLEITKINEKIVMYPKQEQNSVESVFLPEKACDIHINLLEGITRFEYDKQKYSLYKDKKTFKKFN